MEYFDRLLDLLRKERKADFEAYEFKTKQSSAAERRAEGLCWYPLAIRGTELTRGDYLCIELERTTDRERAHQFRTGAAVSLFSNHDPAVNRIEGTVNFVSGDQIRVTIRQDELPDWSHGGKLGLDLLFDNNSYEEMETALQHASKVISGKAKGPLELIEILTGMRRPELSGAVSFQALPGLNTAQQAAVSQIIGGSGLSIVHGPPGTGKTTTLVQAIKLLAQRKQILVVAPSNTAVDLLSEKIAAEGLGVLRIGNPARVSDRLLSLTLEGRMSAHHEMKQVRTLKKQAANYKAMAHKYKRNYGRAEQEQRKALFNEAHKVMKAAELTEKYIIDHIVSGAQVITATLVGAAHYSIQNLDFETVVIDEAGQALEPACWIAILKARKVVLAGDHCQLPPTIKSADAGAGGLSTTLMEKCGRLWPDAVTTLNEQYRMHQLIMAYPSKIFYADNLRAHHSVASRELIPSDKAISFIDTAGCSFDEKTAESSIVNPGEAEFLINHLIGYISALHKNHPADQFPQIGIIAPYQQQNLLIRELIGESEELAPYTAHISVNTVDSFQGQERDIIYISLTRSNPERNIGFLADTRRMNVAMTRAKQKLVIIGDSVTLSRLEFYNELIAYALKQEAYQSAWEYATF